jgi:hypothetical protein
MATEFMDKLKSMRRHGVVETSVDEYDLDEQLQLLDLTDNNLNEENLNKALNKVFTQYKSQKARMFFFDLGELLKKEIRRRYEEAEKLKENERIKSDLVEGDGDGNTLLDPNRAAIGQKKSKYRKNVIPGIPQGDLNQVRKEFFIRVVNFDSKYRKIPPINSIICPPENDTRSNAEKEEELKINIANLREPSTDYTIQMTVPIYNVIEITLTHVEIPGTWYVFDSDYGTDYFIYSYTGDDTRDWKIFQIEKGSYNEEELAKELTETAAKLKLPLLFTYKRSKHRIIIENKDTEKEILIDWASGMATPTTCFGGAQGQKLDSSLGYLMGFRRRLISIPPTKKEEGTGLLDITGPKYFLLVVDEFANNKPNQDLVSMLGGKDTTFKLPEYYNKVTMEPGCNVVTFPEPGPCDPKPINKDDPKSLTKKQQFTVEQIKLAMTSEDINTYKAPASSDVLARISIPDEKDNPYGKKIFLNSNFDYTKRAYFGPVTISKFRIQLLNDRGYIVNLNNMDWSFSLLVKQRYQHT